VGIKLRAPFDQEFNHCGITIVQDAESAGPPLGPLQDVRAGIEQHADGCPITSLHRRK